MDRTSPTSQAYLKYVKVVRYFRGPHRRRRDNRGARSGGGIRLYRQGVNKSPFA
jgi:hypothetical protein